ncbi:N-alpha-acetyltransferase [Hamiltosporidium tvaerminnensis]|uniref:N-alpha-acetyltransferase n=1 Tax=Hamiltosporidium tvaerminnensis TaxID=1176355 RepID=A0A4Q9LIW7_9MICR|nr:hypothetical protein LUQ84_000666 [Hamiltosporidium tvaerminnensis]KAK1350442.1 hypothetical protein LUQ84_000677 [Hamiltosporidium tvaerminnensis]TBU07445.1 N-alpha-acetyltransferase [Hamiltosporidium tvaerminnensis]TBU10246.1 N-alpha-acetyltransferase [Hamiltosporidium tvaerminnensis]
MDVTYSSLTNYMDLKQIYMLFCETLSEPYSYFTFVSFYIKYRKFCFVAYSDNKIVGAIICKLENDESGYMGMLAVDKKYRRVGIGKCLTQMAVNNFKENGIYLIYLETEAVNYISLNFYEKIGFRKVMFIENYYLNLNDAYRLCLDNRKI